MNDTEEASKNGKAKHESYKLAFSMISDAIKAGFPLQAIACEESIISDRIWSTLHALGKKAKHENLGAALEAWKSIVHDRNTTNFFGDKISGKREALCNWWDKRNKVMHGIVKSPQRGKPIVSSTRFIDFSTEVANEGRQLAREISDLTRKQIRSTKRGGAIFMDTLPNGFGEKAVQCRLSKIEDILRISELLPKDKWAFRGQFDANWGLKTTYDRDKELRQITLHDEKRAIVKFRSLTRLQLPQCDSLVSSLAAMQHYGAHTRLLDFSRSLFVALFFAFEIGNVKEDKGKHAVWAVSLGDALFRSQLIRSAIEKEAQRAYVEPTNLSGECNAKPCDFLCEGLLDELKSETLVRIDMTNKIAERLLRGEIEQTHSGILPVDTPGDNPRIAAQDGMFIMAADYRPFEDNLKEAFTLNHDFSNLPDISLDELDNALRSSEDLAIIKFVISEELRPSIQALLDAANISPARLFPDLTGIASNIHYAST